MDKKIIQGNFSRNAPRYEDHASVQRQCARILVDSLKGKEYPNILEIGCGTGIYTRLLRSTNKEARITAVDISPDMINIAKERMQDDKIVYLTEDGENIDLDADFELVTSNASFQWFEDLHKAMAMFTGHLKKGGLLCFSMYGPDTFHEFKKVLNKHYGSRKWLSSSRFIPFGTVKAVMDKYFSRVELSEKHFEVEFISLWDMLKDIKHSGTRGEGLGRSTFLGRYGLREMEKTYMEKYGRIVATHHVFFCKAQM
ncbi:MAG: malonyl-ACP O-methyltransferase BioC [Candidatus Omnitrophica bacterium]|nr:malonyl-ACP O-methyltransferase BioC [Candidatus Omnitrophota bacterium]